jgi:fructose-bisphosphate aldolase/2-amino-3,7-dideoxy-D-threo-hept-6-ulosonate synthase
MVSDSVEAGGAGVAIGRNIFQADSPANMTGAIAGIVHDGLSVEEAVRILKGGE